MASSTTAIVLFYLLLALRLAAVIQATLIAAGLGSMKGTNLADSRTASNRSESGLLAHSVGQMDKTVQTKPGLSHEVAWTDHRRGKPEMG